MRTVEVAASSAAYRVEVGPGLLEALGERVRAAVPDAGRVALVSDVNVAARFGPSAGTALASAGFGVVEVTVPAGEASKSWETAGAVLERLASAALDRRDAVVALGGGVVGDLAGFCAAVYLRGVRFVQAPTTLLAMVDSSVGGKTGVDLRAGKNLAGAFWQPQAVIADTRTLASLPEQEWASGLAEVAKGAFLDGEEWLRGVENAAPGLLAREEDAVTEAVVDAVAFKARVVAADEREGGEREILNYGHTYGHALERALGYGAVPHGLAVAEGIRFAAALSERVLGAPAEWTRRQESLLDALGLARLERRVGPAAVLGAMASDKKVRAGRVRFVLTTGPGLWEVRPIEEETLAEAVSAWTTDSRGEGSR